MAEFAYNNTKNANIGYISLKLNYGYHPWELYEEQVDPRFKSKSANKL